MYRRTASALCMLVLSMMAPSVFAQTVVPAGSIPQAILYRPHVDAAAAAPTSNAGESPHLAAPLTSKAAVAPLRISKWVKIGIGGTVSFSITNNGPKPLAWSASPESWMTLTPSSGDIGGYQSRDVSVEIRGDGLTEGALTGGIAVTTDDPNNPRFEIHVEATAQVADVDTTFQALVEEFVGQWCQTCPYGAEELEAFAQTYGDRMNVISYHTQDDMTIPAGAAIESRYGVVSFPSAMIDRRPLEGSAEIVLRRQYWANALSARFAAQKSPASLRIMDKTYNTITKRVTLKVEVFFHQTVEGDLRLNLVQTRNDVIAWQKFLDFGSASVTIIPEYRHDHVAVLVLPDQDGGPIGTGGVNVSQSSVVKEFSFVSKDSVPELSDLVAFIYLRNANKQDSVLQSHGEPLLANVLASDRLPTAVGCALHQNYPNPFNPSTTIGYTLPATSQVTLIVTDALGRTVATLAEGPQEAGVHTINFDGADLNPGNYFVTMRAGDFVQTRTMTLMK